MSIPEKYKVDHLFLLVGTNPLPNYVAAKLLLCDGGTPYFVHSTKTQTYAKALCGILGANSKTSMIGLDLNKETNAGEIYSKVKKEVPTSGRVGLHYTGGTKVMSVHAYRALRDAVGKEREQPIFSYLDSTRLCLQIERGSNEPWSLPLTPITPKNDQQRRDLYTQIDLNFDTLWKLHGITLNPEKSGYTEPRLAKVAEALAKAYGGGRRDEWTSFKKSINEDTIFSAIGSNFADVRMALDEAGYQDAQQLANSMFADYKKPGEDECNPVAGAKRWLGSDWLEDHTLDAVRRTGLFTDTHCAVETKRNDVLPQFEVDVIALRGYQLFLFSCTTLKTDGECKEKLFEAALRARRLGGDEARFALVCPFWREQDGQIFTGKKIKDELSELLDSNTFTVFDREALKNLPDAILHWAKDLA